MAIKKIIDVSHHQGIIDWDTAKKNIDGAILNCGYGDDITSQDDKQFIRNLSECERLGIPKGVYLYSYAKTETQAKSELAHILRLIKGHTFELPIFLDCEEHGTEGFAPTACKIICEGINASGFTPGVYANTYWWNNYLTSVTAYTRWVAQYNAVCTYSGTYDMWQYTDCGRINGISGDVDVSYYYGDFTQSDNFAKNTAPDIYYQVYTDKSGWLPVVKNLEDYAGIDGEPIKGIRICFDGDELNVTTHQMSNGNVDKLTITAEKHTIRYRVRIIGSQDYFSWMENDKDTGDSSDVYAGIAGQGIDRIQIYIK